MRLITTTLLSICFIFVGSIGISAPPDQASLNDANRSAMPIPRNFHIFQSGYVFGSLNIPVKSTTNSGSIKLGSNVGFEGAIFVTPDIGILTHFSFGYSGVEVGNTKAGCFTGWFLPGAIYEYDLRESRTEKMSVYGLGMAGFGIMKPNNSIQAMGTSGSLAYGFGVGFSYNWMEVGIRFLHSAPKFEYTIPTNLSEPFPPGDYLDQFKTNYILITLGYAIDFYPKRRPK